VVVAVSLAMFGNRDSIVLERNAINVKPIVVASAVLVVKTIVLAAAGPIILLMQAAKTLMIKAETLVEQQEIK